MSLTDIQLKAAKPAAKSYKLADGKGLHLYVATTDLRSWRMCVCLQVGVRSHTGLAGIWRHCGLSLASALQIQPETFAAGASAPAASASVLQTRH
jgi:hypothetical protein